MQSSITLSLYRILFCYGVSSSVHIRFFFYFKSKDRFLSDMSLNALKCGSCQNVLPHILVLTFLPSLSCCQHTWVEISSKKRPTEKKIKFIYSEKATKFCKIFTLLLSYVVPVKSKVNISQNFVAFSECMNFTENFAQLQIKTF